jgi:hypothetical protein
VPAFSERTIQLYQRLMMDCGKQHLASGATTSVQPPK